VAVRTFVALELSESARRGILSVVDELRSRGVRASWTRASTVHLTLKFLGDVEENELPGVVDAVARASRQVVPFILETRALGAFPSPRRPRVLWVGVDAPDELFDLARLMEDELAELGFPRERRRFHPHVTLGRIRDARAESVLPLFEEIEAPRERSEVREVRVMKSTLKRGGALHELVEALPLSDETS
jgi:2'-5' RNA ligase